MPFLIMLMFAAFQFGRLFFTYHTLQKSVRSGVEYLQHTQGVNFCDGNDPAITDARNFIVFGNLQGTGQPVVTGLTPDLITIVPERGDPTTSVINPCPCGGDGSCDISTGGTAPDYIVVNLGGGFPFDMSFPLAHFGIVNLQVTVRLPFLGA